jgi:hypothetical protein
MNPSSNTLRLQSRLARPLPAINRHSGAKEIKEHIQVMQEDLRRSQTEARQNKNVRLLSDVFSWKSQAEKNGQQTRPTENDDHDWKTIPEFFQQCGGSDSVTLAFFSTYYAESGTEAFAAHAWIGIALRDDTAPNGFVTAAWDPDWEKTCAEFAQRPGSPIGKILREQTKELPNLGFFLTREERSDGSLILYGGGMMEDEADRQLQDCSTQCLTWLKKVCSGELQSRQATRSQPLKLSLQNMKELGFEDIGIEPPTEQAVAVVPPPPQRPHWRGLPVPMRTWEQTWQS